MPRQDGGAGGWSLRGQRSRRPPEGGEEAAAPSHCCYEEPGPSDDLALNKLDGFVGNELG